MIQNQTILTDEVIEQLILKKILTDKPYMILIDDVYDKRWFDNEPIQKMVALALKYYQSYDKLPTLDTIRLMVDKYSRRDEAIDVSEYMSIAVGCINIAIELDDKCIEDNIVNYIKNRGSYFAICDNINDIEKERDMSKCIQRLKRFDELLLHDDLGLNYFEEQDRHWEAILKPDAKLSFGIDELDKVTNGGCLADGRNLIVFMAQPGLGKSLTLSNLARNYVTKDKTVVIISLELSEDVYAKRIDAHISGDNIDKLKTSHVESRKKIADFYADHPSSKIYLKEYPPRSISCATVEVYLDRLVSSGVKPDVLILDYINLLNPKNSAKSDGMYQKVAMVAEELRSLTYKYNMPCITATQSNRGGTNNEDIGLENVSESQGISNTADFLMALYQRDEDRDNGLIMGVVLKNRLGGWLGKRIPFNIDPFNLRMTGVINKNEDDGIDDILDENNNSEDEQTEVIEVEMDIANL